METEIEAKFLDIDTQDLRDKLKKLGATFVHKEIQMKRKVFDYPDLRLEKVGGWVRVRDEGDKITLSYKQLNDRTLHGTKEITVVVDSFEKTCDFIIAIGLEQFSFQETKREKWMFENVEITIDTWPWIPTFAELEAPSEELIKDIAQKLELDWKDALHGSVEIAYQKYYNVTDEEIDSWQEITFIPVPDWLEIKRK